MVSGRTIKSNFINFSSNEQTIKFNCRKIFKPYDMFIQYTLPNNFNVFAHLFK